MMNNFNIVEQLVDDKLATLRAEGMRSQMLARAGLPSRKKLLFPDFRQLFHRMLIRVTSYSSRRVELPGAQNHLIDRTEKPCA